MQTIRRSDVISVTQLKDSMTKTLRRVATGNRVYVTSRNRLGAVLCPSWNGWMLERPLREFLGKRLFDSGHVRVTYYGYFAYLRPPTVGEKRYVEQVVLE